MAARNRTSSITLTIKNDSGRNLIASFAAEAPSNFETSFTEAYGSQELSSIPIEAGQSKDIKLKVRPPSTIDAGHFPVHVTVNAEDASAKTELALDVVGQPQLAGGRPRRSLERARGRRQAELDPDRRRQHGHRAGRQRQALGQRADRLEDHVRADHHRPDRAGKDAEAQALITPSDKSLAGDYMASIRAASRGENASTQFRITVGTSTIWGMVGVGVIGVALLLMLGAVARFGRR